MTNLLDEITQDYTVNGRDFSVSECEDYDYVSQRENIYDDMIFEVHEEISVNTWAYRGKFSVCISSIGYCDDINEDDIISLLDEEFYKFVNRNNI